MLIADGGGGSVPTTSVPAAPPPQPAPTTNSTQADAAARARELQNQLEQMLERLREAQRRAEEARQRALEAQQRAETARQAAEAAKKRAQQSGNAADQDAAAKAQQDWKLQDARMKKESADADLQAKDVALQRAQVAQKREQVKSPDGKSSAAADQKVKDAQNARDAASKTNDLAKLYADAQEKESKAQDAEAKLAALRPHNRFEAEDFTPDQRKALTQAQADASTLRGDANTAQSAFATEVDKDADAAFFGSPPAGGTPPGVSPATAAAVGDDPLHSPLLQLLQVSPGSTTSTAPGAPLFTSAPGSTLVSGTPWTANSTFSPFLTPAGANSPQVAQTLSGLADGKSLAQVASDQHLSVDQVVAQARAAGVDVQSSAPSADVQVTTLHKGDTTLTYTHNLKDDSVTVKGSYADASAPGGKRDIDVSRSRDGVFSQTVRDPKTGQDVVHRFDPANGTRTDIVNAVDGSRTETTTDLTAAPVTHTVKPGEGYLDIAKDAGLTPEQLLALNPDVDYGAPLKSGQQLVVVGVQTTVKTVNPDGTSVERSTASDGTLQVVATDASGHRNVLMGDADPTNPQTDAIRKALFDDNKTIAQTAASLGLTEQQVIEALPPGTVDDTPASVDNNGIHTRTIYDAQTNRTFVEIDDPRHDRTVVQEISADQVFHVRQFDPKTGQYVMQDVKGGAGYAQSLADQKQATVDDYGKQISDLDATIRLYHHTGDDPSELLAERARLVALQKDAQGQADVAQGKASSVMTRHEQVQVDQDASIAYQNWFVARPGSKDQAAAAAELKDMLALSDKVDRLVASSDKDVGLLAAGLDKQRADAAKTAADDKLQAAFQDWKANDWGWAAIPKDQADKMKAQGQRAPYLPYYQDAQQENDAAWSDFVDMQKEMDKYGTDGYPPSMVAAHDAWVQRNQASDAALKVDLRFDDASTASNQADQNVLQGDIARLQQDKANWVQAHPNDFSENFDHQGDLDQLQSSLAQHQVDALNLGEDRKFTQYMTTVSAPDRDDPDALKKAEQKYAKDNSDETTKVNRQIDELQTSGAKARAQAADDYIAAWKQRNPELAAKLDALGSFDVADGQSSVRAIEHRQEQTDLLLGASEQGKQLQSALTMQQQARDQFLQRGGEDIQHVTTDRDAIKKDIDGHSFVRDAWDALGGDDASKDAKDYTQGQLGKATQLRNDLASGKISVSDYASQEDGFLNAYDHTSGDFQRRIQDSDGTWSVVDEAVRTTVSAAAGIAATIASGGNVAVGFAVGMGVNELWDTAGDIVEAAQGRDVNADGHTSLLTLGAKAVTGDASWDDVKFTLKDEAVDVASNAVTLTGVGAGARMTESLTAQLALKDSLSVGGRTLLKVGFKEGSTDTLTWGGRAIVGAGAGVTSQAVDGVGRVGVETLHVGLDGQLGTEEGDARIRSTIAASATGLLTAPVTGAFSGAIPLKTTSLPGLGIGGQILNDTAGSLGTGELISLTTEGRGMNRAEFIAASLQIGPSVLQHVAIHPMMARSQARAAAAGDDAATPRAVVGDTVDDDQVLLKQEAADDAHPTTQPALFGDDPYRAPAAARPHLDKPAGQRIVDLVHMAGPGAPQSMTGRTIGLTQLDDGRVVVTVSGKKANLNPNQRRVAQLLLRESGFASDDILMLEAFKGNPFGTGHQSRRLDPDTRPVSWHAEQKGIQAGKLAGSDAVRQWSSSGKNPRGTEQGGHGGAACTDCQRAQADYRVVNETGLQPPHGEPAPYQLSDGREWGGRDDRVDREIPGVDWESLRTRPGFLDADQTLPQAARRGGASTPALAGWDDHFLQRVAQHPEVQDALLAVIRKESKGKGANPEFDLDMLYGSESRVRGTARDNPAMFRRQVLAAWHALEHEGKPVLIDGRTPLVTVQPATFQIRPSRDHVPTLAEDADYAKALDGVTPQSSAISQALRDGRIQLEVLDGPAYRDKLLALGKNPSTVLAMARHDVVTLNKDAPAWERVLSLVHEGTHALDWIQTRGGARTTTIHIGDLEARAYAHEGEFAKAMGLHGTARGDAFPALVRPQVLHPDMRGVHLHIDDAYPQATARWSPTDKASTDATVLDQRSGKTRASKKAAAAAAPKAPPTLRRVYGSAAAGALALGGAGAFAAVVVPAHILGTAFSWATAGAAMRSGVKLLRFSQARKWEGRVASMSDRLGSKATFERALNRFDDLGQKRLAAGADPAAHADFARALEQVRDHSSRVATVPLLRRVTLRRQIVDLHAKALAVGIAPAKANRQTADLKAGASDRAAFDRHLALHEGFVGRVQKGAKGSRAMRWVTGVDDAKVKSLGKKVDKVNLALKDLKDQWPGNDKRAIKRLDKAVRGLSVAPRLRDDPKTFARRAIDTVQVGTYAVSLGSLAESVRTAPRFSFSAAGHTIASIPSFMHELVTSPLAALPHALHAVSSLPTAWPGVVVSSVFAVSTLADGSRILGSRFGAMKAPADREAVTTHPLYAKGLPRADDSATVHGGALSVVKGLLGPHKAADASAALVYTVAAWRQRREARARDYVDPKTDDAAARKKVFNRKIVAAGAGLLLAGEALASQWLDGEKKKDDKLPAAPVVPTTTAPPVGTTTAPITPPPTPAPRSKLVVVDASDPRTAALWGIAHANESTLLPRTQIDRVQAQDGDDGVTLAALRQLFQLNPQRGFKPGLMDGVPSAKAGDPDTIQPGWKIEVQNPVVS